MATEKTTELLAPVEDENGLMALMTNPLARAKIEKAACDLPARMLFSMALRASQRQPELFKCTADSLLLGVITADKLGLDCSGTLRSAYLVPFRNNKTGRLEAQFIIGYSGLIDLARRGGEVSKVEARLVYEGDAFAVTGGTKPEVLHTPKLDRAEGAKIAHVYAVAWLSDGLTQFEVMSKAEVELVRSRAPGKDSPAWSDHWGEMARKTVCRRLCKWLPLSVELKTALAGEERMEEAAAVQTTDVRQTASSIVEGLRPAPTAAPEPAVQPAQATQQENRAQDTPETSGAPVDPPESPEASDFPLVQLGDYGGLEEGQKVRSFVAVMSFEPRKTAKGKPYVTVKAEDNEANGVDFVKWSEAPEWLVVGCIAELTEVNIRTYYNKPQYVIESWREGPPF